MTFDALFDNGEYNLNSNNCLHFINRVWCWRYGHGTGITTAGLTLSRARFCRLAGPENYCLALFTNLADSHIGVYIEGSILHFDQHGVQFVPLHTVLQHYRSVRFYHEKAICNS